MNISEEVRPGANRYVSGQGILQDLESYLASFNKLAIITGEKSFQVFQDFYPKDLSYPVFHYDGSASIENGKTGQRNWSIRWPSCNWRRAFD